MSTPTNNLTFIELMMEQIQTLPLWVKQVIFAQLRRELGGHFSRRTLETFSHENTLQLWVPRLTSLGKQKMETPKELKDTEVYQIIVAANQGKNVITTCITNHRSLETCTIKLIEAMDRSYIQVPTSKVIVATIYYLGNRIRLGEYLVQIDRLTSEQLDQALQMQNYIEESMDQRTGIANVLINLGYIQRQDSEGILFLKDESRKKFEPPPTMLASFVKLLSAQNAP